MGLFNRRRYEAGTVPDHVEELDESVFGPPPSSFPQRPSYPEPSRRAPSEPSDAGLDVEEFYDDEDSEDRPSPEERERPKFLPPPPTRRPSTPRRKVLVRFALFILVMFGIRTVDVALSGPDSVGRPTGWRDVPDVYADIAESDRRLTAQNVEFTLLSNRPLDPEVCSFLEGCLAGAYATWEVTGTGYFGRSWYLVFEDEAAADAAASAGDRLHLALAPAVPGNWAAQGGTPGRFLTLAGVGPSDGAAPDVREDPVAVAAAEGLRIYSTEPAIAELWNR